MQNAWELTWSSFGCPASKACSCAQVSSGDDIKAVASISSGNDDAIGTLIAEALEKVGKDGVLTIETSQGIETSVDVTEGMEVDRGYISPQFITNQEKMLVEFQDALVFITDHKLENLKQLLPLLDKARTRTAAVVLAGLFFVMSRSGADVTLKLQIGKSPYKTRPLLIIAEDVTGEALATLVVNKLRGVLNIAAVKAPGFGERRKALLQDLAIVTGAEFVAKDLGLAVEATELDQLGTIRKVTIGSNWTTLIADAGSKEEIDMRVAQLKKELGDTDSVYDTEKLSERIAKLAGGIAVIKARAPPRCSCLLRRRAGRDLAAISCAQGHTFFGVTSYTVPVATGRGACRWAPQRRRSSRTASCAWRTRRTRRSRRWRRASCPAAAPRCCTSRSSCRASATRWRTPRSARGRTSS